MLRIVVRRSRLLPDGNLLSDLVTVDVSAPEVELMLANRVVSEKSYDVAEVIGASVIANKPRPLGRPRKPPVTSNQPKRPRGRPRKTPVIYDRPKRPRGRPRKPSAVIAEQ